MGESTAVAHAVFIVVSVVMASVLSLVVLGKLSYVQSLFSQMVTEKTNALGVRLMIVNAYRDTVNNTIYIYVKNIGTMPFSEIQEIDIYVGNYTQSLDYYKYNATATPGTFNITELYKQDNVWSPGETLRFNVNPTKDYASVVRIKVVLPNGVVSEEVVDLG
ncbi:MAG: flagellin [Desulfurococcales archaeon]|nr:flagellin [Desulfurococcales archaeon]MEB3788930.1 flagellin [Desulfurococcales archaeon]